MDDFLRINLDINGGTLGNIEDYILDTDLDPDLLNYKNELYREISDMEDDLNEWTVPAGFPPVAIKYGQFSSGETFKKMVSDYIKKYTN